VGWYGLVWHTGTSLAARKAYQHFFSEKRHTGMLYRQFSDIKATGAKFSILLRKIFGRLLPKKVCGFWKLLWKMSLEEFEKTFQRRF